MSRNNKNKGRQKPRPPVTVVPASPVSNPERKYPWVAPVALIVSILGLLWGGINTFIQNRRIDRFNAPKVVVDNNRMVLFYTISKAVYDTTKWEPNFYLYHNPDGTYQIPYYLKVKDSSGEWIKGNFGYCQADALTALNKLHYAGMYSLFKCYHPEISFKNVGQTDATKVKIRIELRASPFNTETWKDVFNTTKDDEVLYPGQITYPIMEFNLMAGVPMRDSLYYRVTISYDDKGDHYERKFRLTWSNSVNAWFDNTFMPDG